MPGKSRDSLQQPLHRLAEATKIGWERRAIRFCLDPTNPQELKSATQPDEHFTSASTQHDVNGCAYYKFIEADNLLMIGFRGSKIATNAEANDVNIQNWTNNLNCAHVDFSDMLDNGALNGRFHGGKIHQGIWKEYRALKAFVYRQVNIFSSNPDKPLQVLIVGHSLGGALAILCAADLWLNTAIKANQISLVTFGSPRVGNRVFATWFDEQDWIANIRVEVKGDPVVN